MTNLLEAMRIFVAVVEHGAVSGAASELKLGDAQVSERLDCLERYLGCRLLLGRAGDDVACTDAGVAFHACCRRTLSAVAQAAAAADACATVRDERVAGFPPPDTLRRVDGASIAAQPSLHRSSP
ncbi:LysR family transcriptional regulator [Burkholderia sp. BCC1977]|uniref:helix-turn-helix domain-containing protein n=1 Tax=Burkholderia sp. BCC1977 TaxID=2817440 RepID=UPI002ABDB42C|nr:LysR family transcriptional regulator [Burkholderia sp. BCC1977]